MDILGDLEFRYIQKLVHDVAGIKLGDNKRYLVEARVTPMLKDLGLSTIRDLVWKLQPAPMGPLHQRVVDALATNETWFFRDFHPFEALRESILPELIKRREKQRSLRIWSAACSTGQEPYSLAFLLKELEYHLAGWKTQIVASDMCQAVLDQAQVGCYKQIEVNRGLGAKQLIDYFKQTDAGWCIKEEFKQSIQFRLLNLIQSWPAMPAFDIILLRNVLIYFSKDHRRAILEKIAKQLPRDGILILGSTEFLQDFPDLFEQVPVCKSTYFRPRVT